MRYATMRRTTPTGLAEASMRIVESGRVEATRRLDLMARLASQLELEEEHQWKVSEQGIVPHRARWVQGMLRAEGVNLEGRTRRRSRTHNPGGMMGPRPS